jgi:hypothetical protein
MVLDPWLCVPALQRVCHFGRTAERSLLRRLSLVLQDDCPSLSSALCSWCQGCTTSYAALIMLSTSTHCLPSRLAMSLTLIRRMLLVSFHLCLGVSAHAATGKLNTVHEVLIWLVL